MLLQTKIIDGWNHSAKGYSNIINGELADDDFMRWQSLLMEVLGKYKPGPLKILDVGTGPGFFTVILSEMGHHVTGIDASEEMIKCAKENTKRYQTYSNFYVMDCTAPTFKDMSFDVIINRNVVWTLHKPKLAYRNWYKLLNKRGTLIVFDADYLLDLRNPKTKKMILENQKKYESKYGTPKTSYTNYQKARGFRNTLPLAKQARPEWDLKVLHALKYVNIECKNVAAKVYPLPKQAYYKYQPMFMLTAEKS